MTMSQLCHLVNSVSHILQSTTTITTALWPSYSTTCIAVESDVDRVKLFRLTLRFFDGVIIYFFNSDFKVFDDVSEFSVTSLYIVFYFLFKVHVNFSSITAVLYRD